VLARLRSRSIVIDGEAVACDDNGVPDFERLRYHHYDNRVVLCARAGRRRLAPRAPRKAQSDARLAVVQGIAEYPAQRAF
jgi:hypothetical protein